MLYQGGKAKVADSIAAVLTRHDTPRYLEPFCGACWVTARVAPKFRYALVADVHPDLMMLWDAVQRGWHPPTTVTEVEWSALRGGPPSALRGFVGFGCSFGGKWFRGYARDPQSDRNFARAAAKAVVSKRQALSHARMVCADFRAHDPDSTYTVYCDPPYASGERLPHVGNFANPWPTFQAWAERGAHVYVSERSAPKGWRPLLELKPQRGLGRLDGPKSPVPEFLWVPEGADYV